jgi:integrase
VKREYGEGTVFQRADRSGWVGRIEAGRRPDGSRRRIERTGPTEAAVRRKLVKVRRKIEAEGADAAAAVSPSVEQWIVQWLRIIERQQRPSSFATTRSAMHRWVIPTIGRRHLEKLTRADLRAVQDVQREAGLKSSSIRRTHTTLVKALKDAEGEGCVVPHGVMSMPAPPPGESDRMAIPMDPLVKVLAEVARADDPSRWVAALFQGVRPAERLGLTWACVDFEHDVLDISWQLQALPYLVARTPGSGFRTPDGFMSRQLVGRWHLTRPKTSAGQRFLPMTPWMRSALLEWRERAPASPHDLVWCNADGSPILPGVALAEWKALQERAGVAHPTRTVATKDAHGMDAYLPAKFILHEARHTTATLLKQLGVDEAVIISILGHASYASTRIYVHDDTAAAAKAAMRALHERLLPAGDELPALEG